ncbi:MAG: hypothetical protein KIT61_09750 [Pyrinomonadaceae bacterium]|nr:hypothetical protein [Pyrinomonadaceae bacterium]
MTSEMPRGACKGLDCGFGKVGGDLACTDGGSCFKAEMLTASESIFHDAALVKATQAIKDALAAVPADPNGRQLSFIHTKMGTMLVWVRHDIEVPPGSINAASSDEELINALGIEYPLLAS